MMSTFDLTLDPGITPAGTKSTSLYFISVTVLHHHEQGWDSYHDTLGLFFVVWMKTHLEMML